MVHNVKASPLTQFTLCTIEQRINYEKPAICARKLVKTEFYRSFTENEVNDRQIGRFRPFDSSFRPLYVTRHFG